MAASPRAATPTAASAGAPARAGLVLTALILAAAVANLNLAVANVGNLVHTIYVASLPVGPIWFLHAFYLGSTALMMCWWLRYREKSHARTLRTVEGRR